MKPDEIRMTTDPRELTGRANGFFASIHLKDQPPSRPLALVCARPAPEEALQTARILAGAWDMRDTLQTILESAAEALGEWAAEDDMAKIPQELHTLKEIALLAAECLREHGGQP